VLILKNQRAQFTWQCEDGMEVTGCDQFLFALGKPALARLCLALRAVAVAT
jgi:hypothetical protein